MHHTIRTGLKYLARIATVAAGGLVMWFAVWAWQAGLFTDQDAMAQFISGYGVVAPLLFMLVQLLQVTLAVIPGGASCTVGVLLFGPVMGFVYNYFSICAGSFINFLLARKFGHKFVRTFGGEELMDKYIGKLEAHEHFDRWFAAAIFLPFFPDDFLCMLAGLTHMTTRRFAAILLLGKPASIALYSVGLAQLLQLALQQWGR